MDLQWKENAEQKNRMGTKCYWIWLAMMFVIELWWYQLHNKAMQESEKRRLLWGEMARIASIMAAARATVLLFNKDISISRLLVRFLWNIEMWVHNDGAARVSIGGRENIKYLAHAPCHVSKKKNNDPTPDNMRVIWSGGQHSVQQPDISLSYKKMQYLGHRH